MTDSPKRFELGQRVRAPNGYVRRLYGNRGECTWGRYSWQNKPIEGIFIGKRTYWNGKRFYDGDGYPYFERAEQVPVALIVTSARTNPVPVPYDELEAAP